MFHSETLELGRSIIHGRIKIRSPMHVLREGFICCDPEDTLGHAYRSHRYSETHRQGCFKWQPIRYKNRY
jgi:hypothetical protein